MAVTVDARDGYAQAGPSGVAAERLRAHAFRRARRHSLLVRVLRLALPVGSLAIVAIYAFTLSVGWKIGAGRLNVGEVQLTADDLTMKNPSYFGLTKEGGRYEVRAKKAIVEFNKDAPIKLIDVDGDLMQANGVVTNLKAKHGLLDNAKSELELFDGIDIEASNGLKARLSRAKVFNKEHRVVSNHPVEVDMATGRVRGATMTMRTDTKETTFVGNVAVHLKSSTPAGGTTPVTPAFGRDSRQPVDVTSEQLYVNDAAKTALFMGGVVAVQGDSTLKAPELHVAYEGKAASELANADAQQTQEASRLSRLVAKNGAVVTMGADRRVTSEEAEFDAKADTALFTGNVVVNQQKNVLRGSRLFVDRKTGKSRLETPAEAGQPPGRIAATFYQNDGKAGPQSKPKSQAGDAVAAAQGSVFGTFKTDPNAPIDIEADTLDVHDQAKQAIFRGKVKSQQGDFIVRTVEMTVHYTGQSGFGLTSGGDVAGKESSSQLTRVEARQKVLIVSKDGQTATGDWANFDVKANTVLMGDHVVVSRGKDVAEGPRLKIDLTTGMYRFELESEPRQAAPGPANKSSPPFTAPDPAQPTSGPSGRECPPGKQCLLFYPKDAKEKAKDAIKRVLPDAPGSDKASEGWQPSTSASPVQRSE
jgi:LPS export ABC transporter protein LptC/lipopolysaccharide transport protein LptA